ncbi:unnamed protein product [Adineta steineri]|uniref:Protein kinase domain-containing protein n=1 Tax=Adineta steineri TaxID=433720 RepID=A0A819GTI0_9BILA|nr:unnamed protein product [Adineta steineri]
MSKSRSTTKSHDSFNQNVNEIHITNLLSDDLSIKNDPDYIKLYHDLKLWLSTVNTFNNEKDLQLDFYQNCLKKYDENIINKLKYTDGFKGTVFKALFEQLMPNFCLIDYYNSHLKSKTSDLDLEFLPFHIVTILELKIKLKDCNIRQLLHYLRIILDYSPSSRTYIIGAITDFHHIQFAKVVRSTDDDQMTYVVSIKKIIYDNEYLLHYLTMFFTTELSTFGYSRVETLPKNIRIDQKLLGIGANSIVFNCYLIENPLNECTLKISNKYILKTSTEYVLKISNESVDKEVSIYEKLYADKYKIIQVHPYAFVFCFPPGQIISKENLFNNIHIIWNQIKRAHENHIVHRDIRMSNIIQILNSQTKNYEILLIDCHSAIEIGSNVKYSGSLSTASNFILDKLSQNSKETIQYLPVDDVISMMKMILLEIIPIDYKNTISSKVRQHSSSGVLTCYVDINYDFCHSR